MNKLHSTVLLLGLLAGSAVCEPVTNVTFVAFDLETTGFSGEDRVVEIGAVRIRNGQIVDRKAWLVDPGISIPYFATQVHGIDDDTVKGKPAFSKAYASFKRFMGDAVLLAHNAPFDVRFIAMETHRSALTAPTNAVINTLNFARARYPDAASHRLSALVEHLSLPQGEYHRALLDAEHTARLFIAGTTPPAPVGTLDELVTFSGGALTFAQYAPQ